MKPYLRIKENPAESISFLIGNSLREVLLRPWLGFLLPLTLYRRIRLHRAKAREVLTSNIEILYLIDAESLMPKELAMFDHVLSSRGNDVIASVGEFESNADYLIPSRKSNADTKNQWNGDLEEILESIIVSRRPKKFIFIGKYPYAGLLSVLRRLESQENTAWLPVRSKPKAIEERSPRFGRIVKWDAVVNSVIELDLESVYVDPKFPSHLATKITGWVHENNLNHSIPHDAGLHFYSESGVGRVRSALERGHLVVYLYESVVSSEFIDENFTPIFFPISSESDIELEYLISRVLELYSSDKLELRSQRQRTCVQWAENLELTFNQKD